MNEKTEQKREATEGGPTAAPVEAAPAPAITPEQLSALKDKAAKADEYWDRLLRQAADLENYKKRAARERQDAVKFANEGLLSKLIPVLDTFEMALAATNAEGSTAQSLQAGITMIHTQLKNTLAEAGLEEIDALGKPFDPNFHEAVAQKETADMPEGQVAQQLRRGYRFRERLIRAASVIVAKAPSAQ
jgi:molecular chaperone GrpE